MVVTQETALFEGTLEENLDPLMTDEEKEELRDSVSINMIGKFFREAHSPPNRFLVEAKPRRKVPEEQVDAWLGEDEKEKHLVARKGQV